MELRNTLSTRSQPKNHVEGIRSWGDECGYSVLYSIGTVPAASKGRVDTIEIRRARRGFTVRREVEGSFDAMVTRAGDET